MVSKMYNCKRAWFGCCSWGSCRGRRSDICFRLVKKMVMITSEIYEIIDHFQRLQSNICIIPLLVVVGQLLSLQVSVYDCLSLPSSVIDNENVSFEGHNDPPSLGNGLSHSLALNFCPPPHVIEHPLQFPQDPHAPSTRVDIWQYSLSIFINRVSIRTNFIFQ